MHACLKKHLLQTIYVRRPTGYTPGGTETLGDPVAVAAHVELDRTRTQTSNGMEISDKHVIICDPPEALGYEIRQDDRVFLPGLDPTDLTFSRQPEQALGIPDPQTGGIDHWEVVL